MNARLLIVEDDAGIRSGLVRALTNAGYDCAASASAAAARQADRPDLVLLDLGLPDGDGMDLALEFQARWPLVPIIMVTARTEEMDVVAGLDTGAVDYITKPFRLAELLARVRTQLRRPAAPTAGTVLAGAGVEVDVDARTVTVDGEPTELRAKEFDVLVALLTNQGKVVTGTDRSGNEWTITVHGPGQVIVTDTTPNDGSLDDDIATIQIINSDIRRTYVTGTVVSCPWMTMPSESPTSTRSTPAWSSSTAKLAS